MLFILRLACPRVFVSNCVLVSLLARTEVYLFEGIGCHRCLCLLLSVARGLGVQVQLGSTRQNTTHTLHRSSSSASQTLWLVPLSEQPR